MRSLLQFLGVWGAWIAFAAGTLVIALWAGLKHETWGTRRGAGQGP